jgi:hypothetical protein
LHAAENEMAEQVSQWGEHPKESGFEPEIANVAGEFARC